MSLLCIMFKRPNFTLQIWDSLCSSSIYPSQSNSWDHISSTNPDSEGCCICVSAQVGNLQTSSRKLKLVILTACLLRLLLKKKINQQLFPHLMPTMSSAKPVQPGEGELDSIHLWATSLDCLLPKSQLVPAAQSHTGQHCGTAIPSPQGLTELGYKKLGWKQPARHSHFSHRHLLTGLLALLPL